MSIDETLIDVDRVESLCADVKDFYQTVKKDEKFCDKYNTSLQAITCGEDNAKPEPVYVFNDGLGGYTKQGIKNSLTKK